MNLVVKTLEEVKAIALGKQVKYEKKNWEIERVEELSPNVFTFYLKQLSGRKEEDIKGIGPGALVLGKATTEDESLMNLCNELFQNVQAEKQAKEQQVIQNLKERDQREQDYQKWVNKTTIEQAKTDSKNNNKALYKLLSTNRNSPKALDLSTNLNVDLYLFTFEKEEEKKRARKLIQSRITNALDDYPGDLEELLKWIKENTTDVIIRANAKAAEREQDALDELNNKLGTNYQVEITEDIYPSYQLRFKNSDKAPKEFKEWIVKKHSNETSDPTVWKDAPALNKGTLKSNSIVKDLLFNPEYKFKFIKK